MRTGRAAVTAVETHDYWPDLPNGAFAGSIVAA
jgi:hypothetical protein